MDAGTADSIADGVSRQLDPRWITVQRIHGAIFAAIVVASARSSPSCPRGWPAACCGSACCCCRCGSSCSRALAWQLYRWPAISYRFASYRLDDEGLEILRGVYWRTITNVPRSRVQHTDVSQGPLERRHGLGTLVIYTAGTQHSQVKPGRPRLHGGPAHPCAPAAEIRTAMPSDHRLHPSSILFALAGSLRAFLVPAVVLMLTTGRSSPAPSGPPGWGPARWMNRWMPGDFEIANWQFWLLLFLIPSHDRGAGALLLLPLALRRHRTRHSLRASSFATSGTCRMRGSRTSTR